jgi:hypothetical protein
MPFVLNLTLCCWSRGIREHVHVLRWDRLLVLLRGEWGYESDPTSYDYDAPISEASDVTYKYWQILEVIKKYRTNIPQVI